MYMISVVCTWADIQKKQNLDLQYWVPCVEKHHLFVTFPGVVVESSQTQTASQYVETHINICRPQSIAFFDKHPKILNLVSWVFYYWEFSSSFFKLCYLVMLFRRASPLRDGSSDLTWSEVGYSILPSTYYIPLCSAIGGRARIYRDFLADCCSNFQQSEL